MILVVEDDLTVGRILFHMIRSIRAQEKIDWFLSAEEALAKINDLEALAGAPYQLIIADITLAGKYTGIDLWTNCQKRGVSTQFLFISGMPKESFFNLLPIQTPIKPRYLQKPLGIPEGKQALLELLGSTS